MASNIGSWLVPVLLGIGCVALFLTSFQTRKVNKSLAGDIERVRADLLTASSKEQECNKKLDAKNGEVAPKDKQIADLTANVNTLTEEKKQKHEAIIKYIKISFVQVLKISSYLDQNRRWPPIRPDGHLALSRR